ncbi:autotransporter domain-containing protein [Microvirga sp. 3-52]|nr:autotransporter domain-containing protein [Microvirga sp. 3-52]
MGVLGALALTQMFGGTSAIAQAGPVLYQADLLTGALFGLDTATGVSTRLASNSAGGNLFFDGFTNLAVRSDQSIVYAANYSNNSISVIDTGTNTVTRTISVGPNPFGIVLSPDNDRIYVANSGNGSGTTVSVINAVTNTVIGTITVGNTPTHLSISPDGSRLYVANNRSNSLSVIDTTTLAPVQTVPLPNGAWASAITPDGRYVYVTNLNGGPLTVVDTSNFATAAVVSGANGFDVAISPDGRFAYVSQQYTRRIAVIDTATNTTVRTIALSHDASGISFSPDGTRAYVLNADGSTVDIINTATHSVIGSTSSTLGYQAYSAICSNGNTLLTSGKTFTARSSGALGCTISPTSSGPVFTGGTMRFTSAVSSSLPMQLQAQGGTLDTAGNTATLSGVISGPGALTKAGNGTLILTGANTYGGSTTITGGNSSVASVLSVTGPGASLGTTQSNITVGAGAGDVAELRIDNGGIVTAASTTLGGSGTSIGSLALLGAPSGRGTLVTDQVLKGSGAASVSFDGGVLQAASDQSAFLSGFSDNSITIGAGGAFLNSNGHSIGISTAITGTGALNKMGSGILTLSGVNSFTGTTALRSGTLALSGNGSIATSAGVSLSNSSAVLDISAANGARTIGDLNGVSGSTVDLGANNVVLGTARDSSFAGVIRGTGSMTKSGSGTMVLSGANTYTGGTNVQAGTLRVNGSVAGDLSVQSGAILGGSGTVGGLVAVANGGTLSAGNSPGVLTVGSLEISTGSNLAFELGTLSDRIDVADDLTLAGRLSIEDTGGFGLGTYRLFNYGGALSQNPLTFADLPVGYNAANFSLNTGTAGQVDLIVAAASTDQYWAGGSGTWNASNANWTDSSGGLAGAWRGRTGIFGDAGGTVTVEGAQPFEALRFETDGYTLVPGTGGSLAIAGSQSDIRVNGGLIATIATDIAGSGRLVKGGAGTLVLTGTNTYTGGTFLNGGVLAVSSDANLGGASSGLTFNTGVLRFDNAFALSPDRAIRVATGSGVFDTNGFDINLAQDITGAGVLVKTGAGTLTLSGINRTNETFIAGGTLEGSAESLGTGRITNNSSLSFNQTNDGSFNLDALSGTGNVLKKGAGALALAGTSLLSGSTDVASGHLIVNGSLSASQVNVRSGGTLGGNGTVGGITANSGAIVAPGNSSIGTLTVAGSVTLQPGSDFQVRTNSAGQTDRITASGVATITDSTVQVLAEAGAYQPSDTYTILTATGGVRGRFASATSNLAFLAPTLGYDINAVTLTLTRKVEPEPEPQPVAFNSVAVTANQYNTATALEALGSGTLFNATLGQGVAGARQAFDALSGEVHASTVTAGYRDARLIQDTVLSRLSRPFMPSHLPSLAQGIYAAAYAADLPGAGPQPAPVPVRTFDPRRFTLWGEGFGSWGRVDGTADAGKLDTSTGGFIVGAEAQVDAVRLGLAGGFTRTSFDVDARFSSGSTESVFTTLYGAGSWGGVNLRLGASYALHDIDMSRAVLFPGFVDRVGASYNGWTALAFGEVGYRFGLGGATLEPFVGASILRLHTDGFVESGGAAALTGFTRDQDLGTTTLGVRVETGLGVDTGLSVSGMLGWRHAYGDVNPDMLLAFAGGASAFTASGVPIDRDALVAEAGLDWQATRDLSIGLSYQGQLSERAQDHGLKGNLTWSF